MKKALIVGIDYYENISHLNGCVNDAYNVRGVLERNGDGTANFDINMILGLHDKQNVSRKDLKNNINSLFADNVDIALFYFAGHGHIEETGGYLVCSDAKDGDDGLSLNDILTLAVKSPARHKIIILDSCHSGIAGNSSITNDTTSLTEGITILTASTKNQYAQEENGSGVFTNLFVDALNGSAANLLGEITPASIYAHIDQSLGAWKQRPVFKTNVKNFVSLRKVSPAISIQELHKIVDFFPEKSTEYSLNPSFEPERPIPNMNDAPPPNEDNTRIFAILQKYNRLNLLIPVDAPHMYHAAIDSKSCKLTVLGEHYRNLVIQKRI